MNGGIIPKVLYLVPSATFGGAETFIHLTAKAHDRTKIEPHYCFFREGPLLRTVSELGHPTYLLPLPPRLRNPMSCVQAIRQIQKIIVNQEIHLVHSTMAYSALFGAPAAYLAQIPHVWFQHGPVTGWMDTLAEILPSKEILFNSKFSQDQQRKLHAFIKSFIKWFLIKKQTQSEVISLGTDLKNLPPQPERATLRSKLRQLWNLNERDFVFGIVCRPQPQKGVHLFIEALEKLQKSSLSLPFAAVILGTAAKESEKNDYERVLSDQASKANFPIRFLPFTSDSYQTMTALNAMDAIVNSSIHPEGFGLTLIEAMSLGKLVIGPREGGPLEIIEDRKTGLFFNPRDSNDLAHVMEKALKQPLLAQELGTQAELKAQQSYSASIMVSQLERAYFSILGINC